MALRVVEIHFKMIAQWTPFWLYFLLFNASFHTAFNRKIKIKCPSRILSRNHPVSTKQKCYWTHKKCIPIPWMTSCISRVTLDRLATNNHEYFGNACKEVSLKHDIPHSMQLNFLWTVVLIYPVKPWKSHRFLSRFISDYGHEI